MKKIILCTMLISIFCITNHLEAKNKMSILNTKEQRTASVLVIKTLNSKLNT